MIGHQTQNEGVPDRLCANVDPGRLRVYATGTSTFHKDAIVRLVGEWIQSDEPGSDFTHVRHDDARG